MEWHIKDPNGEVHDYASTFKEAKLMIDDSADYFERAATKYPDELDHYTDEYLEAHGVIREKIKKKNGGLIENLQKRKAKRDGGEIRQRYALGDRIRKALKRRGEAEIMRAELMTKAPETLYTKTLQGVANAANIDYEKMQTRANEEALKQNIPEEYREDFANALQHLDITSKAVMDNPERHKKLVDMNRVLLQGKEIIQHATEGRKDSKIDMFNNRTGLNLGKKYIGGSYEDLRKEQIDIVLRSIQKLENNEELIPGKDVVF